VRVCARDPTRASSRSNSINRLFHASPAVTRRSLATLVLLLLCPAVPSCRKPRLAARLRRRTDGGALSPEHCLHISRAEQELTPLSAIAVWPRRRPPQPVCCPAGAHAQEEAPRAEPQLVLHGRQVPWSVPSLLLQSHVATLRLTLSPERIGCFNITTVFSHAQTVVLCGSCSTVLCQPTGGKARLTEGCSFRRKN